jgi:hypothetical protein
MSKIWEELLGRVRYPDEPPAGFDDRIPYDDVVDGLRKQANEDAWSTEVREMTAATLAELERRWAGRQKAMVAATLSRRMER